MPAVPAAAYIETPPLRQVKVGGLSCRRRASAATSAGVRSQRQGREVGQYGGKVRSIIGGERDIRLMVVYGYTRLVGYDEKLRLRPGHARSLRDIGRAAYSLFVLRPGHKWSDGQPITRGRFPLRLEDVLLNEELIPVCLPTDARDGKPPKFEMVDDLTVRYTWEGPNPISCRARGAAAAATCSCRRTI